MLLSLILGYITRLTLDVLILRACRIRIDRTGAGNHPRGRFLASLRSAQKSTDPLIVLRSFGELHVPCVHHEVIENGWQLTTPSFYVDGFLLVQGFLALFVLLDVLQFVPRQLTVN